MDRWLLNNTVVKIVALALAIMLWMVVNIDRTSVPNTAASSEGTYAIRNAEVEVRYDEATYTVVKPPQPVTVILEGKKTLLNQVRLTPDHYELFIDVTGLSSGTHLVPVQYAGFPSALTVRVIPSSVEVTLEKKLKVEKPVSVELLGKAKEGYTAGQPIVQPLKVHVTLPESMADELAKVKALVNIEGVDKQVTKTVKLQVVSKSGELMQAEVTPPVAEITIPVTSPFVAVPLKLNFSGQVPPGFAVETVDVNPKEVTVYGPKDAIRDLNVYPGPTVDLSNIREDHKVSLKIPLQRGVQRVDPEYVSGTIRVVPAETKVIEGVPLAVIGKSEGTNVEIVSSADRAINVKVEAAPKTLADLDGGDVQAYVNVSNLPPGQHQVPVEIVLPPHVKLVGEAPKATVEIKSAEAKE
ncbi:CdaA regulatory protein CdaR [Bacillaceae bacterium]